MLEFGRQKPPWRAALRTFSAIDGTASCWLKRGLTREATVHTD